MKRQFLAVVLISSLLFSCFPSVQAAEDMAENELPHGCFASRELAEKFQGALLERGAERFQDELGIETYSTIRPNLQHFTLMPSTGQVNMLVLTIAFSDYPEHKEAYDAEGYNRMLNAPYDPDLEIYEQSVRGFYQWASYGKLDVTATALPVYDAPYPSTHYENAPPGNLVREALDYYYEQGVFDPAQFDNDKDGKVDAFVVNSLITSSKPAWRNVIDTLGDYELGDHSIDTYAHVMTGLSGPQHSLRHEIGHLLGLNDNYYLAGTTNVLDAELYEVMASGDYVNTYYKVLLDWIEPIILTNDDPVGRIELSPVELYEEMGGNENKAVVLIPDAANLPFTEFYIAEYRRGGPRYASTAWTIFEDTPGIVIWHCNTYYNRTRKDNTYFYRHDYLKSVYKSGGGKYGAKDIYVAGDEFSSDSMPDSSFYDGTYTGAYLKVEQVTPEKAVLRAGFRDPNLNPAPVISISEPSVKVIKTGVETVITMTITAGDELVPVDTIKKHSDRLFMYYESGTASVVGMMFSPTKNPVTAAYKASSGGDGAVWFDLPGGAIQYNGKDSLPVTSEKIYVDNTPPEISLMGANPQKIRLGTEYIELGAIATDNLDPEIEGKLEIDASEVNTAQAGSYTVTYSVEDHAGHTASAKRTVIVEEEPPPHEHIFSTDWTSDGTGHWHACECGEKADFAAHDEEIDQAVESTCTAQGKTEGSHCSVCAYVLKAQTAAPLKEHSYSNDWVTNANEHWRECTVCRKKTGRELHTEDNGSVTKPPTEEETGLRTYRCSLCGYEMRTEEIEKLEPSHTHSYPDRWTSDETEHWRECECGIKADQAAHVEEPIPGTSPTCTQPGKTEGSRCAVCEKILIAQTEIPERKHKISDEWSYGTYYEAELGHWHECTNDNCDDLFDLEPHTMDGGVVTTPPTSSKPGVRTYTCEVCKWSRTETIPATGGGSSGGGGGGGSVSSPTQYDITLPDKITGGSVKAEPLKAAKGTTVTLTVEAEEGYELEELQATDKRGKEITLEEKEGKYSFTMPASHVKVTVLFREKPKEEVPPPPKEEPEPVALPFTDVTEKAWYYDAVTEIYSRGIMTGLSGTRFAPELPASRGMVVTMLYRMEGEPAVSAEGRFTDVPEKQYYAPAVAWATEAGLIQGYGDGTFRPDESITREQLVTILYRYGERRGYDMTRRADLSGFFDVGQISPYARESMSWAKAAGLLNGADWGGIDPGGMAGRGQIAAILGRFCTE